MLISARYGSIITAVIAMLSIYSCDTNGPVANITGPPWILVGDSSHRIHTYGISLESHENYDIDVNNDGEADFRFHKTFSGSQSSGYSISTTMEPLHHGARYSGQNIQDTIYWYHRADTFRSEDLVEVWISNSHRCDKTDSILSINTILQPLSYEIGDTLNREDIGAATKYNFYRLSTWIPSVTESAGFRKIVYDSWVSRCTNFPHKTEEYIGIRIVKSKSDKIGWIKVRVDNGLTIIETAIEN